jgi:hypothetical protein
MIHLNRTGDQGSLFDVATHVDAEEREYVGDGKQNDTRKG